MSLIFLRNIKEKIITEHFKVKYLYVGALKVNIYLYYNIYYTPSNLVIYKLLPKLENTGSSERGDLA